MCVFTNPVEAVKDTKEFWHLLPTGNHLTGYQNSILGSQRRSPATPGPHALRGGDMLPAVSGPPVAGGDGATIMVLPVPAVPGTMGPHSFHDCSRAPNVLKDMRLALYTYDMPLTRGGGPLTYGSKGLQVFDYGPWTLAVGHEVTPRALTEALTLVPPNKRPAITDEVMQVLLAFPRIYDRWSLIYAFASLADMHGEMDPFIYEYQPMHPDRAFLPAIDAHTGLPPVPGAPVDVDHTLMFGVPPEVPGAPVTYTDESLEYSRLGKLLPEKVIGFRATGTVHNGDWAGATMRVIGGGEVSISRSNSDRIYTARPAIES